MPHPSCRQAFLGFAVVMAALGFSGGGFELGASQRPPLTVERLASLPSLTGTAPSEPTWSPDSTRLAFLWNDQAMPFRDVWIVNAAGGPARRLTRFSERGSAVGEGTSLAQLAARAAARAAGGVSALAWTPDGRAVVFTLDGDLHRIDVEGGSLNRLTTGGLGASRPGFSPDGRFLSFLRNGDLWLLRQADGELVRATSVSVPPIGTVPNGRFNALDVSMRSYAWSPDSRLVALTYVDLRGVREVPFPDYLAEETRVNVVRRGYPGDVGEDRRLAMYSLADGLTRFVDLPERHARSIIGYQWSPDGASLLAEQDSDDGETRWLYMVRAQDLGVRELWRDHRARRIYSAFTSSWRSDGQAVLFICDTDHYRLCSLPVGGGTPTTLTTGAFDVASTRGAATVAVNRVTRQIFFVSSQKNPYERQVYRMPDVGGRIDAVTRLEGVHEPFVSPDGAQVALLHASDLNPTELYLGSARGDTERRITHSPPADFAAQPWVKPRYVTFKSRIDGFTLHARLTMPPGFDPARKYPVAIGTLYSNTVRNEWRNIDQSLPQFLAIERQYITMQIDLRGSIGYGVPFRESFQGDWGGGDLEDLHSAVEYLRTLPYVDSQRLGVWGTSYGGMMVLFALFERPGLFKVGVAGAPAIEVARFTRGDQHLSRRPNSHPEIFRKSTLLNYGEKLQEPLLIIQGLQDDIVPFKTTVMMVEKLMLLGKDVDLAIVPRSSHVWTEREHDAVFTVRKLVQFLDRHLQNEGS